MRLETRIMSEWGYSPIKVVVSESGEARINLEELSRETFDLCSVGGLRWARYDSQGNRRAQGSDFCTTPTRDELEVWDSLARELVSLRVASEPRYIRFGRLPKDGRSKNHATGERERGVSCFGATYNPFGKVWELAGSGLASAAITGSMYDSVWLLEGEVIGVGSDGEPLLGNPKVVCRLEYSREKEGFECI